MVKGLELDFNGFVNMLLFSRILKKINDCNILMYKCNY